MISYGLDFLRNRGYKKVQPPFMMNKDVMAKTAQLDQFDEELYKASQASPKLEYHLIVTSDRSSAVMMTSTSLPLRNNLSRLSTRANGLRVQRHSSQSNTLATQPASVKRLDQPGVTCGASSVFTNLKKSSSFVSRSPRSRGRCLRR